MKAVMWSIRKPHTDNIKSGIKRDEIRKRIPKELTPLVTNYIYETSGGGGCGKVIGEFKVSDKTYIYACEHNGNKHLCNTAFIKPALSDEDLFNYLYDGKENDGWALRIDDLKIYDKPKELGEFRKPFVFDDRPMKDWCHNHCEICDEKNCKYDLRITRPFQSWGYVEELGEEV